MIINAETNHWASDYIGLPWTNGSNGPNAFDCWGFVRWIWHRHYGITVPEIGVDARELRQVLGTFEGHSERQRWRPVDTPQDGDAVLMRQSRYPVHVGIWVDIDGGGVLHCAEGAGVVFQKVLDLSTWKIEGFYRFSENSPHP